MVEADRLIGVARGCSGCMCTPNLPQVAGRGGKERGGKGGGEGKGKGRGGRWEGKGKGPPRENLTNPALPPSCWEFNYRTNVPYVLNFGALTTLRLHKDISQFDVIIPSCPD